MPKLLASCHCGAVQVQAPRKPRRLTSCNCSICRRYGTLWAYYPVDQVQVTAAPGATQAYVWGDKQLEFVRCTRCGCITHWQPIGPIPGSRMGVNARNFDPGAISGVRVRTLDGADTWRFLD